MNIWFLSTYDQPRGQSSRTYDYAMKLINLGHKVTFFTSSYNHFTCKELLEPEEKWREELIDGIRVIWLKTIVYKDNGLWRGISALNNAWQAYAVGRSIKERPDVVFGPSVPLFTGLSAYFLSRAKKCYFCFEVRDIWPQALIDLGVLSKNNPAVFLLRKIEIFLYKHADRIVAVLPFAYKHICRYGISPDKIIWIPNGVNFERFNSCKLYNGGRIDKLTVMYIGGFSSTHEINTIIESAKCLRDETYKNIRFVLVGSGRKKKDCQKTARDFQVKNIEFLEPVEKSEIPRIQEMADVFIVSVKDTKVYQFGMNSNKLFDYLASGRPIIFAANSPNNPVVDSNAGISIPPENIDAMVEAVKTFFFMPPKERCVLGKNGNKYAQKYYDINILARKLENALLGLVKK